MAKFTFNGMDDISASFETLAQITDEDKMSVIMPAAEFLQGKHQEAIRKLFYQFTGVLAKSITIVPRKTDDGVSALITPTGKHPNGYTGKRNKMGDGGRRSSGKYSGTNAEIAFILEHGSPRIRATHWMENANEEAEDELVEIQQDAWNELLEKKGL